LLSSFHWSIVARAAGFFNCRNASSFSFRDLLQFSTTVCCRRDRRVWPRPVWHVWIRKRIRQSLRDHSSFNARQRHRGWRTPIAVWGLRRRGCDVRTFSQASNVLFPNRGLIGSPPRSGARLSDATPTAPRAIAVVAGALTILSRGWISTIGFVELFNEITIERRGDRDLEKLAEYRTTPSLSASGQIQFGRRESDRVRGGIDADESLHFAIPMAAIPRAEDRTRSLTREISSA